MRPGAEQTFGSFEAIYGFPPSVIRSEIRRKFLWFILREPVLTVGQPAAMQSGSWISTTHFADKENPPAAEFHNSFALFVKAFKRHDYSVAYLNDGGELAQCHRNFLASCCF